MIKEIIEKSGRKIIIDHKNYDFIIDSVFVEEEISNPNSIKIFLPVNQLNLILINMMYL